MQTNLTEFKQTEQTHQNVKLEEPIVINNEPKSIISNKFMYGQYFTKKAIVKRVIELLQKYKNYPININILEPSFGTGNFISVLKEKGFNRITGCEIDSSLTNNPTDFFDFPLDKKYDLIIGNPPFTKYNVVESYFYPNNYITSLISRESYLTKKLLKKEKEKIENIFILKSLQHLKDNNSSLAFVLPISFFIKNRNKEIKEKIFEKFSTIIIYQNDKVWFDYPIPCCFAIFTNTEEYKNKIIVTYENSEVHESIFDISKINEELIPEVVFNKKNGKTVQLKGNELENYISKKRVKCEKSFKENNVSAKNILERIKIPENSEIADYKLAVVRVGNSSVGKCGLINLNKDILNDMFYVFDFKESFVNNKEIKEKICEEINKNQDYFKQITCRVGSKSIKKEDVFNFKVEI
ncbi:SAM-dependent DNA methyltransferase [Candidatus Woesearchaeota archaeon]|nr:SAM-dependent DNA methyltransferase [Candidatus Woesearchaeota archaeon]